MIGVDEQLLFIVQGKAKKNLIVADMSPNGGGVNYLSVTIFFFLTGGKDVECSEMKKYVSGMISSYFEFVPSKSYVLDHSEYIDMHIEK